VARILVADDNSNIQKMVGLALKDQGIDVVAVGNGEAAVRKIADLRPDLVLADVFMPVRNGYEVCKFVKEDSALSHIPVILLVGAFDPLDEQEAQRVGADGVLKKPFVPPDPLISMVKSALQRASAAHAAGVTEKAAVPAAVGKTPASTTVSAPATVFAVPQEELATDSFVDEIPPKPETLKIDSGGQPMAFGSLLETPAEAADDISYATPASPELADRNWGAAEEEEEEEEEDESSASWRRDGGNEEIESNVAAQKTAEKASRAKKRENWTPTREKTQDLLEEAAAPEPTPAIVPPVRPTPAVLPTPAAQTTWGAAKPEPTPVELKAVKERPQPKPEVTAPVAVSEPETVTSEAAKPSGGNSWYSTSSSPWEAEAQKATQLASTWDAPAAPAANEASVVEAPVEPVEAAAEVAQPEVAPEPEAAPEPTYDFVSEAPSDEPVHYSPDPALVQNEIVEHNPLPGLISDGSISPETVETIRQETTYALESVTGEQEIVEPATEAPAAPDAKIAGTSQQDMDALVANVLAKMSPEMLQAVTREILKPVVAAMIRDEIDAKKS